MPICIICREDKTDFNAEHVIPEALGGYYVIRSVCTQCNSELGSKVDAKLTDHWFSIINRHGLKLRNKRGNTPSPFSGIMYEESNPEKKHFLKFVNGKFVAHSLPIIKPTANGFPPCCQVLPPDSVGVEMVYMK